jgi:hypothetical protein
MASLELQDKLIDAFTLQGHIDDIYILQSHFSNLLAVYEACLASFRTRASFHHLIIHRLNQTS